MPIVEYTPTRFDDLKEMVRQIPGQINLAHRPFVDYYYASREWCKLYLYISDSGKIIGTLGRELLHFTHNSHELTIRILSNWYSRQRGVGGELYQYSAQANPNSNGLMFLASQDALNVLRHHRWIFVPRIRGYFLNYPGGTHAGDPWWRNASKFVMSCLMRQKISAFASHIPVRAAAEITVREENEYSDDLLPSRSPFDFHFAPTIDYLKWRYNLSLQFIRYRLFRLIVRGNNAGYVILSDSPNQIAVAQCDGDNPSALAYGILLSILDVSHDDADPRAAFLVCCHPEMERIFHRFGFWRRWADLPFAFRTQPAGLDLAAGPSKWLINFDWGDNGFAAAIGQREDDRRL
jgi:hypothetical protein